MATLICDRCDKSMTARNSTTDKLYKSDFYPVPVCSFCFEALIPKTNSKSLKCHRCEHSDPPRHTITTEVYLCSDWYHKPVCKLCYGELVIIHTT